MRNDGAAPIPDRCPGYRRGGQGARVALPLLTLLALSLLAQPAAAQTPRSGTTVVTFLIAIDDGDLDAALSLVGGNILVTGMDGSVTAGKEEVRRLLEGFPRPIVIRDRHSLGRGRYEAYITAGEQYLHPTFRGVQGLIAEIRIEHASEPAMDSMGRTFNRPAAPGASLQELVEPHLCRSVRGAVGAGFLYTVG